VGEENTPFEVHKDLLTSWSRYFQAAFEGEFRENAEKRIHLADTTEKQFKNFMDWLYFRRLPRELDSDDEDQGNCDYCGPNCRRPATILNDISASAYQDTSSSACIHPPFVELSQEDEEELEHCITSGPWDTIQLYVFADRYEVPALRRCIVDFEYHKHRRSRTTSLFGAVIYATRNLPITSPLIRLIVDLHVEIYDAADDKTICGTETLMRQKLPREFLFAVLEGHCNIKFRDQKAFKQLCAYHEHTQDDVCIQACLEAQRRSRKRKQDVLNIEERHEREETVVVIDEYGP
jgi:hypothetical protein